jgi:hypothetical protein
MLGNKQTSANSPAARAQDEATRLNCAASAANKQQAKQTSAEQNARSWMQHCRQAHAANQA